MKVYELLSEPAKWTRWFYARDKDCKDVDSRNSNAVCWCLAGAINRCYEKEDE